MDWDKWLGVAAERPFIQGYYHPAEWRKRLDFGTGTFGDMGCHILDPVYGSLALTAPTSALSEGEQPNADSWGLDTQVRFAFPATKYVTDGFTLTWYNGKLRPPREVAAAAGVKDLSYQGSVYIGTEGVFYSPYGEGTPAVLPAEKFKDAKLPKVGGEDHTIRQGMRRQQDVCLVRLFRAVDRVSPALLLTRFRRRSSNGTPLLKRTRKANQFVRQSTEGWEIEGLGPKSLFSNQGQSDLETPVRGRRPRLPPTDPAHLDEPAGQGQAT